jgi:hypothetical protein
MTTGFHACESSGKAGRFRQEPASGGVLALSLPLWSFLRIGDRALDLTIFAFILVFNSILAVFVLGLAGLLSASFAAIAGAGVAIVVTCFMRDQMKSAWQSLLEIAKACLCAILRHRVFSLCVGMVLLLVIARMLVHVLFLSPYIWDVMSYHLPKVADWVQSHSLHMSYTPVSRSYWPANFELFQTWFVLFLHHDCLVELAGLPFFGIGIASVYSLCRSCQAGGKVSLVMALSYGLTPAYYLNAVSCKNDIAIASLYLMMAAILMDYRATGTGLRRRLWLLTMAFLLGVGIKPTLAFLLPGLALLALFCFFAKKRILDEGAMMGRGVKPFILVSSFILGAYWYLRNLVLFNNPFYPVDFRVFGKIVAGTGQGGGQQGSFSLYSMGENLKSLATTKIFDSGIPYNPDLENMAGWGWFVFSVGLPCFVAAFFLRKVYALLAVSFLVSLVCLMGFVTPDPWNTRFMTWFPAIFAVASACCFERMRRLPVRDGLSILVVVCGCLNYLGTISTGYMSVEEWRKANKTPLWSRTMLPDKVVELEKKVPDKEILGCLTHSNGRIYPLYRPDFSRKIRFVSAGNDAISAKMREAEVRHLLVFDMDGDWKTLCASEVKSGQLIEVGQGLYRRGDSEWGKHE